MRISSGVRSRRPLTRFSADLYDNLDTHPSMAYDEANLRQLHLSGAQRLLIACAAMTDLAPPA